MENELSRMVLAGTVKPGDKVTVDVLEGELHFDIEQEAEEAEGAETLQPAEVG